MSRNSSRLRLLRWTQRSLLAGALLLLGWSGFNLLEAWRFQDQQSREFDEVVVQERQNEARPLPTRNASAPRKQNARLTNGLIGRLKVPRIGLSVMVMEGSGEDTLRRAAGHIPGTALPGEPGNIGISGHRDTFFRPLKNIQEDDLISLTTPQGAVQYRVVSTSVVSPQEVAVLDPTGNDSLTLVTCYPFSFVGAAPERFIVRAELVTTLMTNTR